MDSTMQDAGSQSSLDSSKAGPQAGSAASSSIRSSPERPSRRPVSRHDALLSVDIPDSTLAMPKSLYKIYDPVKDVCEATVIPVAEDKAIGALTSHARQSSHDDDADKEYFLDDFAVYSSNKRYPDQLHGLHDLHKKGTATLYFDGVLSQTNSDQKFQLLGVPFEELSIGNYGLHESTVDGAIWIRSDRNRKARRDIWYKLRRPGPEYERFYKPFLWVADLAKHVVDFLEFRHPLPSSTRMANREPEVETSIRHFRSDFSDWLLQTHGHSQQFRAWIEQHPSRNFCSDVAVYAEFLWKEVSGVSNGRWPFSLRLFKEILSLDQYMAQVRESNTTIVTPYIYNLFRHMESGHLLEAVAPFGITSDPPTHTTSQQHQSQDLTTSREDMMNSICVGDVISTPQDDQDSGTKWKHGGDGSRWYGLVQQIRETKRGERLFEITWMYTSHDTPCRFGSYPWSNELFLSDHCSCHGHQDQPIKARDVLAKHSVDWFGNETTDMEFFVRQVYLVDERRWVSLKMSDMHCSPEVVPFKFEVGDTVLAGHPDGQTLEPCEITGIFPEMELVGLRKLERRGVVDPGSNWPKNELVYTNDFDQVHTSWVRGSCTIRIFPDHISVIPTPYDRQGTGNCFFIRVEKLGEGGDAVFAPLTKVPEKFRQGFLPEEGCRPLRGLDLFAGCGNLGRGLEDSGAVEVKWVNDIWDAAIHTYMANANPQVTPFLGSVDLLLERALKGKYGPSVPAKGDVEFISGGSPCQGFSKLTANKDAEQQKKNRSLVASFASYIDFYRPKYGILENVLAMVSHKGGPEDYFSQLLCAIVGMGYQVQSILGDAWAHGAPQSRSRVFLVFALPGHTVPTPPLVSHSHPSNVRPSGLGKLSNGEGFAARQFGPTAFRYVSSAEAMKGLEYLGDGRPRICVSHADHRPMNMTHIELVRVKHIPVAPYGVGFATAFYRLGTITERERELFPTDGLRTSEKSRGWTRLNPNSVFPTITTAANPTDTRTGRQLHPREPRTLSILEIRRAQGMPDDDVLVGTIQQRWKLVGNSVARQAAMALGLELRRAMCGSLYETKWPLKKTAGGDVVNSATGLSPMVTPATGITATVSTTGAQEAMVVRSNGSCMTVDVIPVDHTQPATTVHIQVEQTYRPRRPSSPTSLERTKKRRPSNFSVSERTTKKKTATNGVDRVGVSD